MNIPSVTPYTGVIPDKNTAVDENEFANSVNPYLNYINEVFVPEFEVSKTAVNLALVNVNENAIISTVKASEASVSADEASQSAITAIAKAEEANASASIVNAYGNIDWAGFIVSDGDLIVNYFDSAQSTASIVDGDFILTY